MFRPNKKHLQMQMLTSIDGLPTDQSRRLQESWAGTFYDEFFCRIDEEPFAVLYSDKDSRPNIPINVLLGLESLKAGFNWSDEEMYDAFCFDLQVRYALGYRNLGDGQFDLRTMYNFRHRLSYYAQQTGDNLVVRAFEQVTDQQITSFQLKTGKVRMDSSMVASNICNMSRLHLLVEVLQRVHQMFNEADRTLYADAFAPYTRGTSGQYVRRVKSEDGVTHMQQIGELMYKLVQELAAVYAEHSTYQMLKRVFSEHFLLEQDRLRLKVGRELSSSSLQSPDDQDATFRIKNKRPYIGHVINVTETCDPENLLQLIVKVQTEPNVTNDDDMLIEAVPSLKQRLGINEVHTDGGYNSNESYQLLRQNNIKHVQTGIRGHSPHKRLGLDKFDIVTSDSDRPIQITCPQGQTMPIKTGNGRENYLASFDAQKCSTCPFQEKCLTHKPNGKGKRTLHFYHQDVEIARRRQRIAQDRQNGINLRVVIESTIASLKQPFCYDQLPVRGLFRVGSLITGVAALANVRRIHRYNVGQTDDQARNRIEAGHRTSLEAISLSCSRWLTRPIQFFGPLSTHCRLDFAC
jgi:hypothetical protein